MTGMVGSMDNSDSDRTFRGDHYGEIAAAVRELIPLAPHPKAKKHLRQLALKYERLADSLGETSSLSLLRRQAG